LIGWSRGNSSSDNVTLIVRGWPGTRLIKPRFSSSMIIWEQRGRDQNTAKQAGSHTGVRPWMAVERPERGEVLGPRLQLREDLLDALRAEGTT
jgi:hypothetical protein